MLAHGGLLRISEVELNQWIDSMAKKGLMGLECYHNAHTPQMERLLRAAAERNGLLVTGGSDFHGASRPDVEMGTGLSRWNDRQGLPRQVFAGRGSNTARFAYAGIGML